MRWSWSGRSTSTSRACGRSSATPPISSRPSAASAIDSMSHDWWSPELGVRRMHRRGCPDGTGGGTGAGDPGSRGRSFGDELGANDRDLAGGVYTQPDLASFQPDDSHAD